MFNRCSFLPSESCISTVTVAVGAVFSVVEEDDKHIPVSIADMFGDTVGDIAGVEVVLLGSSAETTIATQVCIASSDTLENSWKALRYPVLLSLYLELRWAL